jgi:hypothetical protein
MHVLCRQNVPLKPIAAASRHIPFMSDPQAEFAAPQLGGSGCIMAEQNLKPPTDDT